MGGSDSLGGISKALMSVFSYKKKKRESSPSLWFSFGHAFDEASKVSLLQNNFV